MGPPGIRVLLKNHSGHITQETCMAFKLSQLKNNKQDRRIEAHTSLRISDGKPVETNDVKGGGTLSP